MATYTFRPNGGGSGSGGWWSGTGTTTGGTLTQMLGDNLDTSYFTTTAGGSIWFVNQPFGAVTIPSDEFTARIAYDVRYSLTVSGSNAGNYFTCQVQRNGSDSTLIVPNTNYSQSLSASPITVTPVTTANYRPNSQISTPYWHLVYYAGTGSTSRLYDLAVRYLTMKAATATPTATTMTTNTVATIPVTVAATIDWEASAADSNLRLATVEMRVESGGTGVGTGTLVSLTTASKNWSTSFSATGSNVVNVTLDTALPNGTYKVYTRAWRYREGQAPTSLDTTAYSDQVGAWSTAATLTMNNPLPNVPTVSGPNDDQVNDTQSLGITPVSTAGHTNPTIDVQRSNDGGTTWVAVRNATGVFGAFGITATFVDYECPRGSAVVKYRARVNTTYTGGLSMSSNWVQVSANQLNAVDWNLKCPELPALNMLDVQVIDKPGEELSEDLGVFRPMDRRYPIVVAGSLGGWDGTLTIMTASAAEWATVKALLECQKILYLESNFGWSKYIRLVSGAKAEIMGTATSPRRRIQVQYVETAAP